MWQPTKPLPMSAEQQQTLEAWVQAPTTAQRIVLRSRICLLAAEGNSNNSIAAQLGMTRPTVLLWRNRFTEQGPTGLAEDAPHGRSSRRTKDKLVKAIVEATLHTTPADATHWSTRTMASKFGVSNATICRIWDAHGLHAASGGVVQIIQGQTVRGKANRRGRSLPQSAHQSAGIVRG